MIRSRLILVLLMAFILATGIAAQDEEWTCDGGPDDILMAAEAAHTEGDQDRAWWLAAHAEALCAGSPERFARAQSLRRQLDPDLTETVATAKPGKVELGDFHLFMVCMGEGSPTVLFENGAGAAARETWRDIQPAVSTITRACVYDRRGILPSSPLPRDVVRTTQDHVDDLAALLKTAEIEPPYVLVGHSLAGLNILLFTHQHPDLVAGIVLADVMHPQWPVRVAEADPDFTVLPPGIEQLDLEASIVQVAGTEDFGDRPLAVVTGGSDNYEEAASVPFNEAAFHIWVALQHEWAACSTNSRYMPADKAGHWVPRTRPDVVIEAILWVLDEARTEGDVNTDGWDGVNTIRLWGVPG